MSYSAFRSSLLLYSFALFSVEKGSLQILWEIFSSRNFIIIFLQPTWIHFLKLFFVKIQKCLLILINDGSGSKFFDPGQVNFLRLGSGQPSMVLVWKISPKNVKFFIFLPLVQKKSLWVGSKSTRVKGRLASYLLRVGSGPISNINEIISVKKLTCIFCIWMSKKKFWKLDAENCWLNFKKVEKLKLLDEYLGFNSSYLQIMIYLARNLRVSDKPKHFPITYGPLGCHKNANIINWFSALGQMICLIELSKNCFNSTWTFQYP